MEESVGKGGKGSGKSHFVLAMAATAALAIGAFLFVAINSGYDPRRYVGEAIADSVPLRTEVEEFHRRHGRLPGPVGKDFSPSRVPLKRALRVDWNPDAKMVVIEVEARSDARGRFGYVAEPSGSGIEWRCQKLDLAAKYLPAACR